MTPKQWATVADIAAHDRDWDAHTRALARLVAGPDLHTFTRAQLLERRADVLKMLTDVNDRLAAMQGAGSASAALVPVLNKLASPNETLDPSE